MNVKNIHVRLLCCQHYQNMFTGDSCGLYGLTIGCWLSHWNSMPATDESCILRTEHWTNNQLNWRIIWIVWRTAKMEATVRLCVLFLPVIVSMYSMKFNFSSPYETVHCSQRLEILKFIRFPFCWMLQHFDRN